MENDLKYALDRSNTTAGKLSEVLQVVQNRDNKIVQLENQIHQLKQAIEFYATRYHDENHQSKSFLNCSSAVCQSAKVLVQS